MKLSVNFSKLEALIKKMGARRSNWRLCDAKLRECDTNVRESTHMESSPDTKKCKM